LLIPAPVLGFYAGTGKRIGNTEINDFRSNFRSFGGGQAEETAYFWVSY
jgi:hypothetical protein